MQIPLIPIVSKLWWLVVLTLLLCVSIIGGAEVGYTWLINKAMPCEGFGCIGVGIVAMLVLIGLLPIVFALLGAWVLSAKQGMRIYFKSALLLWVCIEALALISVAVRVQVQKSNNAQAMQRYEQEQKQQWREQGISENQWLQNAPLLDPKRPITILNALDERALKQHLAWYSAAQNAASLPSPMGIAKHRDVPWVLHVKVHADYWLQKDAQAFVTLWAVYFQNGVRQQMDLGKVPKRFCIDQVQCVGVLSIAPEQQERILGVSQGGSSGVKLLILSATGAGNVSDSWQVPFVE